MITDQELLTQLDYKCCLSCTASILRVSEFCFTTNGLILKTKNGQAQVESAVSGKLVADSVVAGASYRA